MMNDTRSFDRRRFVRAALTLILALCLCLSVLPSAPASASAQDDALGKLVSWGVMSGYPDGSLRPGNALTRAEFVALVNRAYGYKETGSTPFLDVPYTAWYSDDISIAYNAGYFSGTSVTTASPDARLTREQAMTLLARSMRLDSIPGEVTEFSDGRAFSTWSRGNVKAAYQKRLISGYPDGSFKPLNSITRGEMAILLSRALGTLIHEPGEHTLGSVYGNVTINTPNATLYDTTIVGDLYITGGLGLGSVVLDNVRVLGSIIVAGGGESEAGQDSVVLRNVKADELKIDSLAEQYLSLRTEGSTVVTQTNVRTDCYIQDRTQAGQGLLGITLEGANGNYTLSGNLEKVVNKAPGSSLKISRGTLGSLTIDETAVGSKLTIESDATVKELNLDTAVNVTGGGDVGTLNVNAAGCSTSMLPDNINIRPGITANINGETMDTTLGQESSSAPRILAGYPKATDVAPTTMTATVSTNKSGTLYWAVSAITDGSVGEEGLLSPAAYGSKAVKYGTLQVGKSNTELKINVTGLTIGGNYYFSAMLVDARNDRSPVKVVSFSTPDNTVPAFASGYPKLDTNWYYTEKEFKDLYPKLEYKNATKYYVDFYVKSTKTCKLYWAVYTKGSTAPTASEFRANSLAGSVAHGVQDATRNQDERVLVEGLKELTDYDIYFWLCDADGVKSSAVKKLSFKTVDGTPPVFNLIPTLSADPKATSLSMTTNVNENATVYWVAVLSSNTEYPEGKSTNSLITPEEWAILQVTNGINGVKSGKVTVKANVDATINISGLKAETSYDIWYIAKDTAGNYSAFYTRTTAAKEGKDPNYVQVHTLDTTAPIVTQVFSNYDESSEKPFPTTDISLVFSEDVLRFEHLNKEDDWSLLSIKDDPEKLKEFLETVVYLKYLTPENKWADATKELHFETAKVELDTDGKQVILTFRGEWSEEDNAYHGVQLGSGTTYYFELYDLADTSTANNRLLPAKPYKMEQFTTVSSKVILDLPIPAITEFTPKDETKKVQADAIFTMTPEATKGEDQTKQWEMLIWANATVQFQVYRRTLTNSTVNNTTDPWEKVGGPVNIRFSNDDTNDGSFLGQALNRDIEGTGTASHFLYEELEDDKVYEYAINILSLNNNSERSTWSTSVTFQFDVVAGSTLSYDLCNPVNATTYGNMIKGGYVDNITDSLRKKAPPFQITVDFQDSQPPAFSSGWPMFNRYDTSIEMTVALNRPGKIYWIAMPLDALVDTKDLNGVDDKLIKPENNNVFGSHGNDISDVINHEKIKNLAPGTSLGNAYFIEKLAEPAAYTVYAPGSFNNPRIKVGSKNIDGTFSEVITISDLEPSTGYFIYVALQGAGPDSYSEYAQLYQVATTLPDRPVITLSLNAESSTAVDVYTADKDGHDMATHVNYVLIQNSDAALTNSNITGTKADKGLKSLLLSCMDSKYYENNAPLPDLANKYRSMTLLEALKEPFYDNENNNGKIAGSVFDVYADQDVKNSVYQFITGGTSNVDGIITTLGNLDIPVTSKNNPDQYTVPVECKDNIEYGPQYVFLATAINAQGTSDNAFGAYYSVVKLDDEPPCVQSVLPSGELTLDANNRVTGDFMLLFSKNLFYYDRDLNNDSKTKQINMIKSSSLAKDSNGKYTGNDVSVEDIVVSYNPSGHLNFNAGTTSSGTVGNVLTLHLSELYNESMVFKYYLCNASGRYNEKTALTLKVSLKKDDTGTYVVVNYKDWNTPNGKDELLPTRSPVDFTEDASSTAVGQNLMLRTVTDKSVQSVEFKSSDPGIAEVKASSTNKTTAEVTPKKAGKVTITATAKDSAGKEVGKATCTVTVRSVTMTLNEKSLRITEGETYKLIPTITPTPTVSPAITWSSTPTGIVEVRDGTVTGVSGGTTTITATAKVGDEEISASCTVTVTGPAANLPPTASVSYEKSTTLTLDLIDLDKSMVTNVLWYTSDSKIASAVPITGNYFSATLALGTEGIAPTAKGKSVDIWAVVTINGVKHITSTTCVVTVT